MGLSSKEQEDLEKKVPKAVFIEQIEEACRSQGTQNLLAILDQQYNKYRLVQGQLARSSQSMQSKIPEIEKTVQMIECLQINPKTEIDFMLSDGIFVKGQPKQKLQHVSLWLGANTIVQLTFKQAKKLLMENFNNARSSLKQITEQLAYIKDQKTITEVNVARVYNFSIVEKRQQQIAKNQ